MGQSAFRSWVENPKLGNIVCMGRVGRGKDSFMQDQTLSDEGAKGILASHRFLSGIRKISRVNTMRLPVKRDNGTIELLPAGYDPQPKIFTNKTADFVDDLDIESAKANLAFLLSDTAFSAADKERSISGTLAMMLAPFCDSLFGRFTCRPSFIVRQTRKAPAKRR
jgi:hypothetical protein